VSVDELIAQADAICARYRDREAPLRVAIPRDDSPEAYRRVAELLPQLAALLRAQIDELERLEAPAELETSWRENLDRLARSAELLDGGGAAAAAHDRESASSLWRPKRGRSSLRWQRSRNKSASRSAGATQRRSRSVQLLGLATTARETRVSLKEPGVGRERPPRPARRTSGRTRSRASPARAASERCQGT
jgi:hypothetical protein